MEQQNSEDKRESLDQKRATFAYRKVSEIREREPAQAYRGLAQNLAVRLLQNGLGQTVAFLMSKAEGKTDRAEAVLLDHLSRWLIEERKIAIEDKPVQGTERLMSWLNGKNTGREQWARAQEEAIILGSWLKRFSEALIPKQNDRSEGKGTEP